MRIDSQKIWNGFVGLVLLLASCDSGNTEWEMAIDDPAASHLAKPSEVQYNWQEMERGMFIQLDPATIQGGEYDNGTTPMKDIRFEKLDVNEWVCAAKAWGAKEIIFMLAHSGGFCMWPSSTTEYHIGNTSYCGGNGDVVKEFGEACQKNGLNMGFYCWSPHPSDEEEDSNTVAYTKLDKVTTRVESNKILQIRMEEIAERIGSEHVTEIWIDQPIKARIGDVVRRLFPNAVIQAVGCHDPLPTIRWPGNEQGKVDDPCWSVTTLERMNRVFATQFEADANQTQVADDPDGDYWAPHEADVPLHDHYWHMRPGALENRRSVDELLDCYIQSVGRNSFLLLNCAPQADGSIHPDDMKRYEELGQKILDVFGHPVVTVEKVTGNIHYIDLPKPTYVNYTDLWEEYKYGQRIRSYLIEGFDINKQCWVNLSMGTSVGRRKIDLIEKAPLIDKVKLTIKKNVGIPMIRKLMIHGKMLNNE